jgi:hypothetical protein
MSAHTCITLLLKPVKTHDCWTLPLHCCDIFLDSTKFRLCNMSTNDKVLKQTTIPHPPSSPCCPMSFLDVPHHALHISYCPLLMSPYHALPSPLSLAPLIVHDSSCLHISYHPLMCPHHALPSPSSFAPLVICVTQSRQNVLQTNKFLLKYI